MNLYLIRHGQTYLNKYDKMQGWSDTPLTEEGIKVANACAEKLKLVPFDAMYSSDLGRTIETAAIIKNKNEFLRKKDLISLRAFRESFFGGFEGSPNGEAWGKIANSKGYTEVMEFFFHTPLHEIMNSMKAADLFHDAESFDEFWERVSAGLTYVVEAGKEKQYENVLIVTHGNTIRNIVHKVDHTIDISEVKNSSITVMKWVENSFAISSFNG